LSEHRTHVLEPSCLAVPSCRCGRGAVAPTCWRLALCYIRSARSLGGALWLHCWLLSPCGLISGAC